MVVVVVVIIIIIIIIIIIREIITGIPLSDTSIKRATTLFKCITRIP